MPDIDWQFVSDITRPAADWPQSKREEWDRLRVVNGKRPEGENMNQKITTLEQSCAAFNEHRWLDRKGWYVSEKYGVTDGGISYGEYLARIVANDISGYYSSLESRVAELEAQRIPLVNAASPVDPKGVDNG